MRSPVCLSTKKIKFPTMSETPYPSAAQVLDIEHIPLFEWKRWMWALLTWLARKSLEDWVWQPTLSIACRNPLYLNTRTCSLRSDSLFIFVFSGSSSRGILMVLHAGSTWHFSLSWLISGNEDNKPTKVNASCLTVILCYGSSIVPDTQLDMVRGSAFASDRLMLG